MLWSGAILRLGRAREPAALREDRVPWRAIAPIRVDRDRLSRRAFANLRAELSAARQRRGRASASCLHHSSRAPAPLAEASGAAGTVGAAGAAYQSLGDTTCGATGSYT